MESKDKNRISLTDLMKMCKGPGRDSTIKIFENPSDSVQMRYVECAMTELYMLRGLLFNIPAQKKHGLSDKEIVRELLAIIDFMSFHLQNGYLRIEGDDKQ